MSDPVVPDSGLRRSLGGRYALAALAIVSLALVFGELGRETRVDEPSDLDNAVHAWVVRHRHAWPAITHLFHGATLFGNPDVATLATAMVGLALFALARRGVGGFRKA